MADLRTVAVATSMVFTLGFVCFTQPGFAQQPDSSLSGEALKKLSIEQLMNLQVTSVSKRPERLSQTASAIQVITQEDIRRSGASSLAEALRLATNLQVAQVDSRQWAISARGFNSTTANKLLVLIDGRTVYTPLFSGVFWDVQEVPLQDIDRIEVISGPGATLWGANAVNGVINVITKDAKDTQGLLLSGGGGTEQHGFGTVRYGAALGSRVRARIYGRGFDRDATMRTNGQDAADDWYLGQGGFRIDWEASSASRATLQGDLYDGRISQPSPGADIAVSGGNVTAKWSRTISGKSSLAGQLYYDRTHRDIPGLFAEDLDTYDVDLQHGTRLGARHDVVWGLGYRLINDRIVNSSFLAFLPAHVARQWFTGFVQDEIALVPNRLHVALGTKIEHNDYTGFEIQPSGRVNWRLSPSGTLWAAVSRALRTPSRIDRELFARVSADSFLAGGPGFHSEEELAYELGYRHQQGSLALSVATFYSRYHGLRSLEQVYVNPLAPDTVVIGNGQDGESYGAELTADYRVTDRWRLRAGYTELRVHVWPNPGSTDMSRGATESQAPDRQFFLLSSVDLPAHLGLAAWFRAIDDINNQVVPAYAELNVTLTWRPTSKVECSLVGQNLLHSRHREFGAAASPTRRDIQRGVYGAVAWRF
ncbi:MAG: TonB-dependent receptor [Gemmatimonadetes bacterium]|nr:MAG: TonB-dependent receptor [Gemmatimonadota bacterium]